MVPREFEAGTKQKNSRLVLPPDHKYRLETQRILQLRIYFTSPNRLYWSYIFDRLGPMTQNPLVMTSTPFPTNHPRLVVEVMFPMNKINHSCIVSFAFATRQCSQSYKGTTLIKQTASNRRWRAILSILERLLFLQFEK